MFFRYSWVDFESHFDPESLTKAHSGLNSGTISSHLLYKNH